MAPKSTNESGRITAPETVYRVRYPGILRSS